MLTTLLALQLCLVVFEPWPQLEDPMPYYFRSKATEIPGHYTPTPALDTQRGQAPFIHEWSFPRLLSRQYFVYLPDFYLTTSLKLCVLPGLRQSHRFDSNPSSSSQPYSRIAFACIILQRPLYYDRIVDFQNPIYMSYSYTP